MLMSKLGASLALTGRKEENLKKVGEQCGNKVMFLAAVTAGPWAIKLRLQAHSGFI